MTLFLRCVWPLPGHFHRFCIGNPTSNIGRYHVSVSGMSLVEVGVLSRWSWINIRKYKVLSCAAVSSETQSWRNQVFYGILRCWLWNSPTVELCVCPADWGLSSCIVFRKPPAITWIPIAMSRPSPPSSRMTSSWARLAKLPRSHHTIATTTAKTATTAAKTTTTPNTAAWLRPSMSRLLATWQCDMARKFRPAWDSASSFHVADRQVTLSRDTLWRTRVDGDANTPPGPRCLATASPSCRALSLHRVSFVATATTSFASAGQVLTTSRSRSVFPAPCATESIEPCPSNRLPHPTSTEPVLCLRQCAPKSHAREQSTSLTADTAPSCADHFKSLSCGKGGTFQRFLFVFLFCELFQRSSKRHESNPSAAHSRTDLPSIVQLGSRATRPKSTVEPVLLRS